MSNESYLNHAKSDLSLSKLAFESYHYHQSIFFLQQANEKLAKAVLEKGEMFNNEQLKKFSHNAVKPFLKFCKTEMKGGNESIVKLEQKLDKSKEQIISKDFATLMEEFEKAVQESEEQINQRWEQISEQKLNKIFKEFDDVLSIETELNNIEIPDDFLAKLPTLASELIPGMAESINTNKEFQELFNSKQNQLEILKLVKALLKYLIRALPYFTINTHLNLILSPHVSESRYPSNEAKSYFTYNEDHLLIKNFYKIHAYSELAIKYYVDSINVLEELKFVNL